MSRCFKGFVRPWPQTHRLHWMISFCSWSSRCWSVLCRGEPCCRTLQVLLHAMAMNMLMCLTLRFVARCTSLKFEEEFSAQRTLRWKDIHQTRQVRTSNKKSNSIDHLRYLWESLSPDASWLPSRNIKNLQKLRSQLYCHLMLLIPPGYDDLNTTIPWLSMTFLW